VRPMKILTISNYFPYPPQDGTRIQIFQRIRYLSENHSVTLLCVLDEIPDPSLVEELSQYCQVKIMLRPKVQLSESAWQRAANFVRSYVSGIPYYFTEAMSTEARRWIRDQQELQKFNMVEADIEAGLYLCDAMDAFKVWVLHSVSDANEERRLRVVQGWIDRFLIRSYRGIIRRFERHVARRVDMVAVLTPENVVEMNRIDPAIAVSNCLTNGVDLEYFRFEPPAAHAEGVCFVGSMEYHPNPDAALHFYHDIWPAVRRQVPSARFVVVGSKPTNEVVELAQDPSVEVTGFVDDVRPLIRKAGVAVAPLRMGGGILNKVLEAMAMGVPIVASGIAVHGLAVESGVHLFVADDDEEFAAAVKRLLVEPELRRRMAAAARRYVETSHQWRVIVQRYETEVAGAVARRQVEAATDRRSVLVGDVTEYGR
jgi:sugar transferase (PEP-CTERM/EpsH1 system associated)